MKFRIWSQLSNVRIEQGEPKQEQTHAELNQRFIVGRMRAVGNKQDVDRRGRVTGKQRG